MPGSTAIVDVDGGAQVDVDQRIGDCGARQLHRLQVADDAGVVHEHVDLAVR